MKKVLSLVLVAVLAIGMGMSGFANTINYKKITKFADIYNGATVDGLIDGVVLDDSARSQINRDTVEMGIVYAQDKLKTYINLYAWMFNVANNVIDDGVGTYYARLDTTNFPSNPGIFSAVQNRSTPVTWEAAYAIMFEAAKLKNPSVGAPVVSFNFTKTPRTITATESQLADFPYDEANGVVGWYGITQAEFNEFLDFYSLRRPVNNSVADYNAWFEMYQRLNLVIYEKNTNVNGAVWFYEANGAIRTVDANSLPIVDSSNMAVMRNLSNDEIRDSNIAVFTQIQEESSAVKEVNFLRGKGQIEIVWATRYVSVDKKDFLLTVGLSFDGRRDDDHAVTFVGQIYNKELKVYANANTADISEGMIAIPAEFNSKIALYVGNGATIHTKLFKDKKYYCTTSRDPDEADDIVFRQYADVDNVLTFYPVGVNNTGDYVTLSTDYDAYYVYDRDMNYLGRGNEQLAYSSKYYLANKRLDIATDEEPADYETPAEVPYNPTTGGDGQAANNVNSNPGTGR